MFFLPVSRRPLAGSIGGLSALFFGFLGFYPTNAVSQDFFPFLDDNDNDIDIDVDIDFFYLLLHNV